MLVSKLRSKVLTILTRKSQRYNVEKETHNRTPLLMTRQEESWLNWYKVARASALLHRKWVLITQQQSLFTTSSKRQARSPRSIGQSSHKSHLMRVVQHYNPCIKLSRRKPESSLKIIRLRVSSISQNQSMSRERGASVVTSLLLPLRAYPTRIKESWTTNQNADKSV